jgi:integrase
MAKKILTARAVETAKAKKHHRREIPDGTGSGLYLSIEASGRKCWVLRYRADGRQRRRQIGDVRTMSLAAARAAAATARHLREENTTPTSSIARTGDRVQALAGRFMELHAYRKTRPSTAWATERVFNRLILPAWGTRSIGEISRRDVIALVEHISIDRPYLANRTLAVLSKFFGWLCARDEIPASPVTGVERPFKEEVRQRTLSDAELRSLWLACEDDGPFGDALRLLILTAARRDEVGRMRWSEIDEERRLWILPRERSKNHREHAVPLSRRAEALLRGVMRFEGCAYVFSVHGSGPIAGWAKAKSRISAKAGLAEDGWRLHDIRRTAASGMQRIGVAVPVIERALNHVSGTFRGIVGTYQTFDYADEVREALQRWADHVAPQD